MEKTDRRIEMRGFNQTRDIPYSDAFNVEEHWVIVSPGPEYEGSIVRVSIAVLFSKSPMFKSKIENSSQKAAKDNFTPMSEWIKE